MVSFNPGDDERKKCDRTLVDQYLYFSLQALINSI